MERATRLYWALVVALSGASLLFTIGVRQRREAATPSTASLATGDIVSLAHVVDGDTVVVKNASGDNVTVRLLGIRAFSIVPDKDPASYYGKAAIAELSRRLEDKPARVMLAPAPRNRYGRTLAELFVDDEDVGLELVKDGIALVYTAYPFAAMPLYLNEQFTARGARRGLWNDADMVKRAERLAAEWRRQAP